MQEMHLLAEREMLGKLKAGGLLKGSVNEMVDYRIGALFMPHGKLRQSRMQAFKCKIMVCNMYFQQKSIQLSQDHLIEHNLSSNDISCHRRFLPQKLCVQFLR